jgi:hypothetical protein
MFRETRPERNVRQAYDMREGWRRKALLDAIAVLNRAHEDKAANILRRMRDAAEEGDPNRPSLAGDERACRRKTLSHAIAVLKDHKENAAASILHRMLDAEQRGAP